MPVLRAAANLIWSTPSQVGFSGRQKARTVSIRSCLYTSSRWRRVVPIRVWRASLARTCAYSRSCGRRNGRWSRVALSPICSISKMAKAKSVVAAPGQM